jgi:CheY-like chemotaxis protein
MANELGAGKVDSPGTADILIVEDDDVQAEAVVRSLRKAGLSSDIVVAPEGWEALAVLRGTHTRHRVKRPYIVLLDLNLPRLNGLDFLREVRADPLLNDSVVFVLTTSDDERDCKRAYEEHVAGYMVKSDVGPDFSNMVRMLRPYLEVVRLPR